MKKLSNIILVIGIIFLGIPFIINTYSILRLFGIILGIILITISIILKEYHNLLLSVLVPIILVILSYGIDIFLFYNFSKIPIYSIEIKSSDNISTYNNFFYRIFNCNNKLYLDYGYEKNYLCNQDELSVLDINYILKNPPKSFQKYKKKFIKVTGKISGISGMESITLSKYTTSEDDLNGYVTFDLNTSIKAIINSDLSKYRIYDIVTVIGRVDSIDGKIITLRDAVLIPSKVYDDYKFVIKENNNKSLVKVKDYYFYGIDTFNVMYADDNVYELSYLLTDNRITWDMLIDNAPSISFKDEQEELVAKKYELDQYNLLECVNGSQIIASKKIDLTSEVCNLES